MSLTIFSIAYNVESILYPWRESVSSACAVADEVIVCEGGSDDGTAEELESLCNDHANLNIIHSAWITAERGGDETNLMRMANLCTSRATSDWVFYLNMDEILCEWSNWDMDEWERRGIRFGRPHYTHFLGDFDTTFPFCYDRATRVAHKAKLRQVPTWTNDACEISVPVGERIHDLPVEVHHYGKVSKGREVECGRKEREFTALYGAKHGFPDPTAVAVMEEMGGALDYGRQVRLQWSRNGDPDQSKPFRGRHSRFVQPYLELMNEVGVGV